MVCPTEGAPHTPVRGIVRTGECRAPVHRTHQLLLGFCRRATVLNCCPIRCRTIGKGRYLFDDSYPGQAFHDMFCLALGDIAFPGYERLTCRVQSPSLHREDECEYTYHHVRQMKIIP